MAVVIPTGCGSGESDHESPKPPVNTSNPTVTILVSEANVF